MALIKMEPLGQTDATPPDYKDVTSNPNAIHPEEQLFGGGTSGQEPSAPLDISEKADDIVPDDVTFNEEAEGLNPEGETEEEAK
jgi:hypothetical protein